MEKLLKVVCILVLTQYISKKIPTTPIHLKIRLLEIKKGPALFDAGPFFITQFRHYLSNTKWIVCLPDSVFTFKM